MGSHKQSVRWWGHGRCQHCHSFSACTFARAELRCVALGWTRLFVASSRVKESSWSYTSVYHKHGKRGDGWRTGRGQRMMPVDLPSSSHSDPSSSALWQSLTPLREVSTTSSLRRKPPPTASSTPLARAQDLVRWFRLRWSSAVSALSPNADSSLDHRQRVHPTRSLPGTKSTHPALLSLETGTDRVHDSKIYCSVNSGGRAEKEPQQRNLWLNILICLFLLFHCSVCTAEANNSCRKTREKRVFPSFHNCWWKFIE